MSTWHIINISISVACAGIWAVWIVQNRDRWRFAIAPLTYLLHVILFYVSAALHILSPVALNMWSNGVRLHGLILVGAIGVAFICAERCRILSWKSRK